MATAKAKDASEIQSPDDLVEVYIPIKNKDDPNYIVSINDNRWVMPRGQSHMVPRFVAEEIKRSERADAHRYKEQMEMLDKAANAQ